MDRLQERQPRPLERERKWVGDAAWASLAHGVLGAWAEADAEHPEGELESVYFDTPDLLAWREKANGDSLKRKIRIRWYREGGLPSRCRAWLEVKDRIGSARKKMRHAFTADGTFLDTAPLESAGWKALLEKTMAETGWGMDVTPLLPAVSIRYRRRRYRCPATGSRLSVDHAIECPRANAGLLPFAGPMACPHSVCETKSAVADRWPFAGDLMRLGFRLRSFSKFGYFMEKLLDGGFR